MCTGNVCAPGPTSLWAQRNTCFWNDKPLEEASLPHDHTAPSSWPAPAHTHHLCSKVLDHKVSCTDRMAACQGGPEEGAAAESGPSVLDSKHLVSGFARAFEPVDSRYGRTGLTLRQAIVLLEDLEQAEGAL